MKRAIGIVRVSEVGDRQDLASPDIQADRIRDACAERGIELLRIAREIDVSGAKPLERRSGLRGAVEAVEAGDADIIMVAYFDRLVRSLKVQQEVVERVEAHGGEVLTLDVGKITNGSAIERLTGNFLGAVAQFYRDQTAEKSAAAQERAIARGVHIGPVPVGYRRGPDKRLVVDDALAPVVREAFERRAEGASRAEVRAFLAEHGIDRTLAGVGRMLTCRTYLGEVRFGKWVNPDAHPALVDAALFERVRRTRASAGRKGKSERLLARQGVLLCGGCHGRMVVGSGSRGVFYRCGNDRCTQRTTIYAAPAERKVLAALADYLTDMRSAVSAADAVDALDAECSRTQAELDDALLAFTSAGVGTEPAAVARLAELRAARDTAFAARAQLGSDPAARIYGASEIVARGRVDELRDLLRAVGCRAVVAPGRVADRLAISFEQSAGDAV